MRGRQTTNATTVTDMRGPIAGTAYLPWVLQCELHNTASTCNRIHASLVGSLPPTTNFEKHQRFRPTSDQIRTHPNDRRPNQTSTEQMMHSISSDLRPDPNPRLKKWPARHKRGSHATHRRGLRCREFREPDGCPPAQPGKQTPSYGTESATMLNISAYVLLANVLRMLATLVVRLVRSD